MKALLFLWSVLQFGVSQEHLPNSKLHTVANRYDINEGVCSPILSGKNILYSLKCAFDECATLCDEYAECQSFQWNETGSDCQTYNSICFKHIYVNFTYSFTKMERTGNIVFLSITKIM